MGGFVRKCSGGMVGDARIAALQRTCMYTTSNGEVILGMMVRKT